MNKDNERLKEIQILKLGYKQKMLEAETITEAFEYQDKYNELEAEEKEILERFDVYI